MKLFPILRHKISPAKKQYAAWMLFSLGLLLALGCITSLYSMWPETVGGTYAFEGEEEQSYDGVLYFESKPALMNIEHEIILGNRFPTRYAITPDDCLEELRVNGNDVDFPKPLCLDQKGVHVSMGEFLQPGNNIISFAVRDHGGYGGVSIAPAYDDPAIALHIVLIFFGIALSLGALLYVLKATGATALLMAILLLGLVLRLLLSQSQGYSFDVTINQGWSKSAAVLGLAQSYKEQVDGNMTPNYPPFSLMIFAMTGEIYEAVFSPHFDRYDPLFRTIIKFPAMLTDLLTAVLLYWLLKKKKHADAGLVAALVYTFQPAVIYNSAVWGQVDSIYTLFIVAAICAAYIERWYLVGSLVALALGSKLQAIIIGPIALLFCLRGLRPFVHMLIGGAVTAFLFFLPFIIGGSFQEAINVYIDSVGYYPSLAYGAYNFWQALYGSDVGRSDHDLMFGVISYRKFGMLLFLMTPITLMLRRWKQHVKIPAIFPQSLTPILSAALIAYAFFLFNTEMHERYLFPMIALGIPWIFVSRGAAWAYGVGSILFYLNLVGQLPFNFIDEALYNEFTNLRDFVGAGHVAAFAALFGITIYATRLPHERPAFMVMPVLRKLFRK